jgi:UDP-N-acetylmuramyl pentapeptide synthase
LIKKIEPSLLVTIGFFTKNICEELGPEINCNSYTSIETLLQNIKNILKPRQLILIKGSNGTGLWKLIPFFKNYNQEEDNAA